MGWHLLEKLLEQVGQHSTLIGKFWTTFFFVLRLLVVISISDDIFKDDEKKFVCNTITPGCENVCFNHYSPISLLRLWALQLLSVAIASVMFIVYTAHKMAKIQQAKEIKKKRREKKRKEREEARALKPPEYNIIMYNEYGNTFTDETPLKVSTKSSPEENKKEGKKKDGDKKDEDGKKNDVVAAKLKNDNPPRLFLAYVAQVVARMIIEIVFLAIQMRTYMFKFVVPELFKCGRWPCPNVVDCFISRPKEKTILIWIMFSTAVIMIGLSILELHHIGFEKVYTAWKRRGHDITKDYKNVKNNMPYFGHGGRRYGGRYRGGYPQAVGIPVAYARSDISRDSDGYIEYDVYN